MKDTERCPRESPVLLTRSGLSEGQTDENTIVKLEHLGASLRERYGSPGDPPLVTPPPRRRRKP